MITGYGHFVQLADSLQWDETTIDLSTDIESWTKLEDSEYDRDPRAARRLLRR